MNPRLILKVIVALVASVSSIPVAAQMTGSRLGKNAGAEDAKAVLDVMVACAAKRSPTYVRQIMLSLPGSDREHRLLFSNESDLGLCMTDRSNRLVLPSNVELTMTARQFRIGLSKALAEQKLQNEGHDGLKMAPKWGLSLYEGDVSSTAKQDNTLLALYYFGDCVVASNPADAAAFLLSDAGTTQYSSAWSGLVPSLGPCVPAGAEIKITPDTLSVALAEPIYHRLTRNDSEASEELQVER